MYEPPRHAGRHAAWCAVLILAVLSCPPAFAQAAGDPAGQPPAASTPPQTPWYQTISLNGLVSTSYVVNFNSPASRTNQFRIFDTDERTFTLDVVELVVQRPVSKPGDAGFRVDMAFGSSVPHVTAALGLFRDLSGRAGDFDVQQAFLSYVAPVGRGVRLDAGKFVTHVGYEVIESYDRFDDNHSRGLLFGYAEPFTHTGLRVSYPVTDVVSAQVLVVNGWDDARDNNSGKSVGAQLAVAPTPSVSLTASYIGGPEQADNNSHLRQLLDLVAAFKATPALTLTANYDYGTEAAVTLPETAGGGVRDSTWQGLAGYVRYALSGRAAVTLRGEWFDDPQGARTGFVQTLKEITFTPEFRPHQWLVVRGDLRRDWSDKAVFELADGTFGRSQVTASINALLVF
jgi:Putative beta-barrel porin-2, OmpL-like. bbp2